MIKPITQACLDIVEAATDLEHVRTRGEKKALYEKIAWKSQTIVNLLPAESADAQALATAMALIGDLVGRGIVSMRLLPERTEIQ
jgi:hypothetical protein